MLALNSCHLHKLLYKEIYIDEDYNSESPLEYNHFERTSRGVGIRRMNVICRACERGNKFINPINKNILEEFIAKGDFEKTFPSSYVRFNRNYLIKFQVIKAGGIDYQWVSKDDIEDFYRTVEINTPKYDETIVCFILTFSLDKDGEFNNVRLIPLRKPN